MSASVSSPPTPAARPPRRRALVATALAATVALGLLSRRHPLPGLLAEHAGDALWTVAAFWLAALAAPAASGRRLAAAAWLVSAAVEASQLLGWPWLRSLRGTALGALLLGHGAKAADLVAYAVGALLACAVDATFARAIARRRAAADTLVDRSPPRVPRDR